MIAPRRFLPSIASLRALEALDRLGSASAVAEELALTQSAISRQLQTLETQMGVSLIQRSRKRLTLTQAARDYVTDIRPALHQIAQASMRLQVPQTGGALNLAILPAFGMRWLMPRLPEFARVHPEVTINMATRLQPFNFAAEPFDAAIHFGTGVWPGADRLLLKHEQMLPVCAPDLLLGRPTGDPAALLQLPLLHIQTRPHAWQDWFAQKGIDSPGAVPGTLYDQFSAIIQAALHGLGVALLPDYLAEQDLAMGRLIAPFGPAVEMDGAYYLVWPQDKSRHAPLTLFRDWLATQAQPEDLLPR
ncbi:LysR family transcriptional regulator [Pseudodonghicola flavimaris]|uniref:LysR family transcriptional regulator n=1 Tax=Pseudodonghicola flavimaris TaxID=3050036 RepID=A0ABT7F0Z6_9RHOB|nr:LysR family transcriptional regulator [Pseudodonghicola flavimaris]MDK3018276.1 LysR family transcriptional regulator [Pseudodonghicola flavimaris]